MKLSRQMLTPIGIISFVALSIFGILSYKYMEREIYDLYTTRVSVTLRDLHEELDHQRRVSEYIIDKFDDRNLALTRALAEILRQGSSELFSLEEMDRLARVLGVDEVHVANEDGILIAGNIKEYLGIDFNFSDQTRPFLQILEEPTLEIVQAPGINGRGHWRQYTGVNRTDAKGFVQVGLHYNVVEEIKSMVNIANRMPLVTIGQSGFAAILQDGKIIAHKRPERIGVDVSALPWYQEMMQTDGGFAWHEIEGERYLTGHSTKNGVTAVALVPELEYYNRLHNIRNIGIILTLLSTFTLAAVMFLCVKRSVLNPIGRIADIMSEVSRGNLNVALDDSKFSGEFADLKNDINRTIAQLRIREERVINNYPGVIWCCDTDYICTLLSGKGLGDLGLNIDMFLGKNMIDSHHAYGDPRIADMLVHTFKEGPQRLNIEFKGHYLTLTTDLLHDVKGNVTGLVGVCLDITDIQQMQRKLEDAIHQADQANKAKSEFLSRMSHEIRTPMNAIIGMNIIAQKTDDIGKIHYCLKKIRSASDQLLNLINNILDMSKIEANKFELYEDEFDFERMLQNICNIVDVKVAEKNQNFLLDFNEVFTRNVIGDELRLSQVILNLLTNAVKFTPDGENIVLKIRYADVDETFGTFTFDIIDNGIGIAAENQKHLFSSFEQADGSITRRYGGTGLGLSICKNIVNLMGGDITFESDLGKGSHFSFSLNLKWGNRKDFEDVVHTLPRRNIRILVIDDSEDVREYFSNILELHSLSCDTAADGYAGINSVTAAIEQKKPYDLIFVDWIMPGLNGIETVREIKKLMPKDTIVIMISVAEWSDIEKEASTVGVDKFLAKPVLPSVLFTSIVEWLNASSLPEKINEERIDWSGKKMLLVEDIDINREIIISMLHETSIAIDCAENGKEAVEMFKAAPRGTYNIILMDLQMPEMDGYEATRQIRQFNQSVPIIAMTANAFKSDVEECLAAGMNDHIAKPLDPDALFLKLDRVLTGRNAEE